MAKGKWQAWCEPANLERVVNWAANGCTYAELAHNMGIGERTLYEWLEKHPPISQAIKDGRALACEAIENALFRRAVGAEATETVEEFHGELRDGKPQNGSITKRTVTKRLPPDTGAAIFYLKNRMPDRYADRRETKVDVSAPTIALGVEVGRAGG